MEIKVFKLINAEEILAEVVSETETHIEIKNPLLVVLQRSPQGEVGVGFLPYMGYVEGDKKFTLLKDHIIFVKGVEDNLKNQYNTVFGNIVTPTKKLILA